MKNILVTGGAGFIGSHTTVELISAGYNPILLDDFSNSTPDVLVQVEKLAGQKIKFYEMDLLDKEALKKVFSENKIDGIIHFAGLKAVGESNEIPKTYYRVNIESTLNLLDAMEEFDVQNLVFSSSATVYGVPGSVPITEGFPLSSTNPYGKTKLYIEEILRDQSKADSDKNFVLLRYFNPVGAHPTALIGENPSGVPNNLMPYVARVATGSLAELGVFGNDYPTPDGTGVRDYIHVVDLAKAHVAALSTQKGQGNCEAFNVGTGNGYSVLDMVVAFEKASGKKVPYKVLPRREGDVAECWADSSKLFKATGWKAQYGIDDMCEHLWKFMEKSS
jgi:UDP-glucose 4-epimerase